MLKKTIKWIRLLSITFILSSCEGYVGENGVVIDMETGERIPNVEVRLETSNVKGISDSTDLNGYFETATLVGCVFGGCEEYRLVFQKDGYKTKEINELYKRDLTAKFVNESDTLVVELKRN